MLMHLAVHGPLRLATRNVVSICPCRLLRLLRSSKMLLVVVLLLLVRLPCYHLIMLPLRLPQLLRRLAATVGWGGLVFRHVLSTERTRRLSCGRRIPRLPISRYLSTSG